MNDWLALHLAMVSGIQGREPALQRASLSQENQCNIMVPGLTHCKDPKRIECSHRPPESVERLSSMKKK